MTYGFRAHPRMLSWGGQAVPEKEGSTEQARGADHPDLRKGQQESQLPEYSWGSTTCTFPKSLAPFRKDKPHSHLSSSQKDRSLETQPLWVFEETIWV